MAAPVRYLSGRQQQQKIGIEGSTQNEKVLEVVGQVGIGTTIFEPSKQLDVRGDVIVSGELTVGDTTFGEDFSTRNLSVSGVSTFTGAIDANGSLDVDGHTELDNLNVSGVSTFTGAIDANGSLDVDGHTELDDVNVSGAITATTFTGNLAGTVNTAAQPNITSLGTLSSLTVSGVIDANGDLDVDGHTELDNVNVSGVSTFTGAIDANGDLDVDGHTELDDVNVSGILSATTLDVTGGGSGGQTNIANLNVTGFSTFAATANFSDIDVDGHTELDNLNVSGVSTFVGVATFSTNDVYVAQRLFVGGVEVGGTTNTFAGINTFTDTTDNTLGNSNTGAVQLDGGLGVDKNVTIGAGLSVAGNAGIGSLNVVGVSTFGGLVTVTTGDVYIAQRLFVGGLEVEGSGSENTFTGINTFTNQADNTLGDTNTGSLQGNGGLGIDKNASFGSTVFVQNAIGINSTAPIGQFDVNGHTELDDVNVSGAITATTFTGNLAGTVNTAAQPNITSLGTLGSLTVSGDITANGNIVGDGLTNISNIRNISAIGISSATAFANFDYLQAPFGSTVTFTVTVASKDATHRYNGTGSGSAYLINGVQAPFLTLTPGRTYRFTNDNTGSHPLKFYLEADKTTEYTSGVNFQNSYTEITVSDETPTVLHYQCSAHAYMGNAVQVNSNVVNTNYAATLRDSLTVSGDINANGNIVGDNSTNISGINQVTATTFVGNFTGTASTATIAEYTSEWNITSNGSSDYRFTGPGFDGTENDPTIYLTRGEEYKFTNNMGAHPFQIRTAINGSAYNDGITNNGVSNGTLTWDVQMDAPNVLYYQCTSHAGMVGKIYIGNSGSSIDIDGHIETDTLNVSGISTFTGAIDANGSLDVDGHTELDDVNVSGVSTFTGAIDANGDLDVDGHTELDQVNVSGVTTFNANVEFGNGSTLGPSVFNVNTAATMDGLTIQGGLTVNSPIIVDFNGGLDVDGHTELDDVNVSGASTFAGAIDANGGLDVSGGAGLVASSAKISDLTDNRIVIAGASGELEDTTKLTFDGSTLTVVGDASFNGNVTIGGTLTSEDKTNVDSIGLVTARSGVRISAGGLVVTSGVSTFTDNIIGNLTGTATTATNLAGGDVGDIPYQSANGTTTFVDATGVAQGLVLLWNGNVPIWSPVSGASGNFGGITLQEEGSTVGSAGSVIGLNFVGDNITATAPSGIANGTVTLSDTPTFDSLKVTGITTIPNVSGVTTFSDIVNVGTGITFYPSSGIVSATQFFGSGENLTDLINQRIEGVRILDEGSQVGSGFTFTQLNFVGNGVVATGIGTTGIITITDTTFEADADENLFAGTCAGGTYDPASGTACFNIFLGSCAGKSITEGDYNIFLGEKAGCENTTGNKNVFLGSAVGLANTTGSCNNMIGVGAGQCATVTGSHNTFFGTDAGRCATGNGNYNNFIGINAGCVNTTGNRNTFIGDSAGRSNTTGSCNNMMGVGAGSCATVTGSHNTFLGTYAGKCASGAGNYNNFIGFCAGLSNTTGDCNVFIGNHAGTANTTAQRNIMIGDAAGDCATLTNHNNVFLGSCAGKCATGDSCYNTFIGFCAGFVNDGGDDNNFFGRSAGRSNTTGSNNTFIGKVAGSSNTTGSSNLFVGPSAGCANTTGNTNIFLGSNVGIANTSGRLNIYIGSGLGQDATSSASYCNIVIGQNGGRCLSGNNNILFGDCTGGGSGAEFSGSHNFVVGTNAGRDKTTGDKNLIIGFSAGQSNSGSSNVLLAECAGRNNTGNYNFFVGSNAGRNNTADNGIFLGSNAGQCNTTGASNVFLGNSVGTGNTSGGSNIYIGSSIANNAVSSCANANIVIGQLSARCISGNCNIILGCCAGGVGANLTGDHNFIAGYCAGKLQSTGNNNLIIGQNAGQSNSGSSNVMFGTSAGNGNTGDNNFITGPSAGANNTADYGVFLGSMAGKCNTSGTANIFIGCESGCGSNNKTGSHNTSLGRSTGANLSSGAYNTFLGNTAGKCVTTGLCNIYIGCAAGGGTGDKTGTNNVVMGSSSGCLMTSGSTNVFLGCGVASGGVVTGSNNVSLGCQSGNSLTGGEGNVFLGRNTGNKTTDGDCNFFGGYAAGYCNTTGCNNVAIGYDAGRCLTTNNQNIFLGRRAGFNQAAGTGNIGLGIEAGNTQTSGNYNIAIGYQVNHASTTGSVQLAIGCGTNRWIAGDSSFNVTVSTASTFSSDGLNVTGVVTATDFNSTSDARLKTNVQVISDPLDKIVRIDGVSFNWIKDNKPSMGVIADNIQEVLPELVSDTDPKTVNYNGLIGLLIEVVKDQQTQINSLNERLSQLE